MNTLYFSPVVPSYPFTFENLQTSEYQFGYILIFSFFASESRIVLQCILSRCDLSCRSVFLTFDLSFARFCAIWGSVGANEITPEISSQMVRGYFPWRRHAILPMSRSAESGVTVWQSLKFLFSLSRSSSIAGGPRVSITSLPLS